MSNHTHFFVTAKGKVRQYDTNDKIETGFHENQAIKKQDSIIISQNNLIIQMLCDLNEQLISMESILKYAIIDSKQVLAPERVDEITNSLRNIVIDKEIFVKKNKQSNRFIFPESSSQ